MDDKTALEKISGHSLTGLAANALAVGATVVGSDMVIANAPWLAMIPGAIGSIAISRMEARLTENINKLSEDLADVKADNLSENQLAFVMETVSAMFSTVDAKKLGILKEAAKKAAFEPRVVLDHGALLGRVLRNLSTLEIDFLIRNFGHEVRLFEEGREEVDGVVWVNPASEDSMAVSGLLSLGLLLPVGESWADKLAWSRTASKVLALVS